MEDKKKDNKKTKNKSSKNKEVEKLKQENNDLENKYKRALADYQNLVKQTAREKEEFIKYSNEEVIKEILIVYDNLKLSLASIKGIKLFKEDTNKDLRQWLDGVKLIKRQFKDILEKFGVEKVETKDKEFNPQEMEAIKSEPTSNAKLQDIVALEVKPGYKLNGKLIIPARVSVYKYIKEK